MAMEDDALALLAPVAGGRAFWGKAPQKVPYPLITLLMISGARDYTHSGGSGWVNARVQADVYAETFGEARQVMHHLIGALSGRSQGAIRSIRVLNERDLPAADAGDVKDLFRRSVDLSVQFMEHFDV